MKNTLQKLLGVTLSLFLVSNGNGMVSDSMSLSSPEEALYHVVDIGDTQQVQYMLTHTDVNVNIQFNYLSPLHIACYKGHKEIVKLLLSHKDTRVDDQGFMDYTALHYAVKQGRFKIVRMLLSRGANFDLKSRGRCPETPYQMALRLQLRHIAATLKRHYDRPWPFEPVYKKQKFYK